MTVINRDQFSEPSASDDEWDKSLRLAQPEPKERPQTPKPFIGCVILASKEEITKMEDFCGQCPQKMVCGVSETKEREPE
jgi:hypothetical protein